jgi:hypothetical protein
MRGQNKTVTLSPNYEYGIGAIRWSNERGLSPRRIASLVVVILAVTFSHRAAETEVPNFRWGDTAAAMPSAGFTTLP